MAELKSGLVSIHGLLTFITDVYSFLDASDGDSLSITVAFAQSII